MHTRTYFAVILAIVFGVSISAQGQWTTLTTIGEPQKRHENAFVELNGKFYLIGGRGIKPVNVYDVASNTWSAVSAPPVEIHHFQAVAIGDELWLPGAMTGRYPDERPLDHILIYQPASDTWKEGPALPADRLRGSCGVVVTGDYLVLIAGIYDGHNGDHKKWVDAYHLPSGKWEQWPDAPRERDHFAAVVMDGSIYCSGGRITSKSIGKVFELTVAEMDVLDVATKKWTTVKANLPTGRAGCSAVAYKGHIVVIGGESAQVQAHGEVEAYDPATGTWTAWPMLQTPRHGTQAIVYNEAIFICAGSGNRGGGPELNTTERFTK